MKRYHNAFSAGQLRREDLGLSTVGEPYWPVIYAAFGLTSDGTGGLIEHQIGLTEQSLEAIIGRPGTMWIEVVDRRGNGRTAILTPSGNVFEEKNDIVGEYYDPAGSKWAAIK